MERLWKNIKWYIRGHLVWHNTNYWIKNNEKIGDMGSYDHVPQKLMSKWEWWVKWSNLNSC